MAAATQLEVQQYAPGTWDLDTLAGPVLRGDVARTEGLGTPRPRPVLSVADGLDSVAVIVTTHAPYLRWLRDCLASVEHQTAAPDERILIVDDARLPSWVAREFPGWRVISGTWHDPNAARNVAIAEARSDWVIVVDGDNWLDAGYVASCREAIRTASKRVGIVYGDLSLWRSPDGQESKLTRTPPTFDYWRLRLRNYISTTSAMRRGAVQEAGGYGDTDCYDDWALAHRMTARGWLCQHQPVPICVRHGAAPHRVSRARCLGTPFLHGHRTYGILSLMAGRAHLLPGWERWLAGCWLPRETALYVLDNSRSPEYGRALRQSLDRLTDTGRFRAVTYRRSDRAPDTTQPHWRSYHVGHLYNESLPAINEDMVCTLEDDMLPGVNGLRDLIDCQPARAQYGSVAAAYLSRLGGGRVCAAFGHDYCERRVYKRDVRPTLMPVGVTGGGFTLYANALLKKCLPYRFEWWGRTAAAPGTPTAWDTIVSHDIQSHGYKVGLLGSCWADHLTVES